MKDAKPDWPLGRCCFSQQLHGTAPPTSFADVGHRIFSSGIPDALAVDSTGLGTGVDLLPLPLGLPGWLTTAVT
jgi:hypothetical protein